MPVETDPDAIAFAKEREGELVGRSTSLGREFQVGRITGVDEEEGRIGFETVQRQASGEREKQRDLRAHSDRGLFDLRPDVREAAEPGTFAIEGDELFEATAGGMGGGQLGERVFDLTTTARARERHSERSSRARSVDEAKRAQNVTTDFERWSRAPGRFDYPGIDTPPDF